MPRRSKGPRLALNDRGMWIIRDGQANRGTGCHEHDREGAERELAKYILAKHKPEEAIRKGDANQAKIADVLSLEMRRIAKTEMPDARKRELINELGRIGNWFGNRVVGDLNGELQERYAIERIYPAAAWRDLKLLSAAINRYLKRIVGGVQIRFSPVLPNAPEARERWLTRQEAAKLIRVAWRQHGYLKGAKFYTSRHIARFILCGLYTGSRAGDVCGAALLPTIGRGYVDLDRGIFKRKPDSKKETSKRQPTTPLPPRLLVHLRRWHRLGISNHSVIEHHGRQIGRVRQGFQTAVRVAGLATDDKRRKVTPHTLRHTAISWYLASGTDIELVAQFTGVSVPTIRKVYRHALPGIFNPVLEAAHKFGR
jgi:integrase